MNELLVSPEGNAHIFTVADLSIVFSTTVGKAVWITFPSHLFLIRSFFKVLRSFSDRNKIVMPESTDNQNHKNLCRNLDQWDYVGGGAKQHNATYFDGYFSTIKIICAINEV